ncbi:MAG TPA: FecR family protein [Bacteroidales bacterium]|nr:FecR family protein [Bacteroidales bacterium]
MKENFNIDELLLKYLTGEASESEKQETEKWISGSVENEKYFAELNAIFQVSKNHMTEDTFQTDLSWERVKARHYRQIAEKLERDKIIKRKTFFRETLKYAAILILGLSLGFLGFIQLKHGITIKSSTVWHTIEAPYGSRVKMTLADGSKVWLNAGSNMKYSSIFGQVDRKVFLDGEAYFNVAKDSSLQFVVSTPHLDVKVYGTEFNVKAYSDEDIVQTTLVSGSVTLEGEMVRKSGEHTVVMEPLQTATFYKTEKKKEDDKNVVSLKSRGAPEKVSMEIIPDVHTEVYTSWKDPLWYIESEPLKILAEKLERRYNVRIEFGSKSLESYKINCILKDETLEMVLNALKLSVPIQYTIRDNMVVIYENKYLKNSYDEMLIKK